MPRGLERWQAEGDSHFVTFSCYQRRWYLTDEAKRIFLQHLETRRRQDGFFLYGYVLMPEHVHLLLSERKGRLLSETFRVLKTNSSMRLRGDLERFWESRYYDFNVFTEKKRVEKLRYMHRNPVVRGLVQAPEDYRWSSFRHYALGEQGLVEIESEWNARWRERRAHSSHGEAVR